MAAAQVSSAQIIDPATGRAAGIVRLEDILQARARSHHRENQQERVLGRKG
jgi:hypothetical protein